jgi:hypothetical protein
MNSCALQVANYPLSVKRGNDAIFSPNEAELHSLTHSMSKKPKIMHVSADTRFEGKVNADISDIGDATASQRIYMEVDQTIKDEELLPPAAEVESLQKSMDLSQKIVKTEQDIVLHEKEEVIMLSMPMTLLKEEYTPIKPTELESLRKRSSDGVTVKLEETTIDLPVEGPAASAAEIQQPHMENSEAQIREEGVIKVKEWEPREAGEKPLSCSSDMRYIDNVFDNPLTKVDIMITEVEEDEDVVTEMEISLPPATTSRVEILEMEEDVVMSELDEVTSAKLSTNGYIEPGSKKERSRIFKGMEIDFSEQTETNLMPENATNIVPDEKELVPSITKSELLERTAVNLESRNTEDTHQTLVEAITSQSYPWRSENSNTTVVLYSSETLTNATPKTMPIHDDLSNDIRPGSDQHTKPFIAMDGQSNVIDLIGDMDKEANLSDYNDYSKHGSTKIDDHQLGLTIRSAAVATDFKEILCKLRSKVGYTLREIASGHLTSARLTLRRACNIFERNVEPLIHGDLMEIDV